MDGRIFETFPKLLVQFQDGGWVAMYGPVIYPHSWSYYFVPTKNHEEETVDNEKLEVS
jgi:hypothetical protein